MNTRLEQLSLAARRMAASGRSDDAATVASWLYRFGTLPRGSAVERDFGPDDDPMAVLGLTSGGAIRRRLEGVYAASSFPGWYSFAHADTGVTLAAACKLYVSPRPDVLADAFPRIADVFARFEVRSFKVGRRLEGLLRPDKIVAYFDDRSHLHRVAAALERELSGCPVHGVPFTAEVGGNGLLSAGVDPPPGHALTSWRAWVTRKLAAGLTAGRDLSRDGRVSAALAAIRLAGVDPEGWVPNADLFRDECTS